MRRLFSPLLGKLSLAGMAMGLVVLAPVGVAQAETAPAGFVFPDVKWQVASQQAAVSYTLHTSRAGGNWYSYVTMADRDGALKPAVEDQADTIVWAYSVNKLAVALTVMDKVDKGELKLDQKLTLTPEIIAAGSGIYHLQTVYGDNLTIANLMTAMLLMSDNTAVRMLSQVASGTEINATLRQKGFTATHVDPVPGSNRFFLGQTTPREMNQLLEGLARHTLVSESSSTFVLNIMRWVNGYNDGVRRNMSSAERAQVATKYGAFEDSRHEAGVIFDSHNQPAAVYVYLNEGVADPDNYGATNPAVQAEAAMGRELLDILNRR
jgi:beta-lactamase class A